MKERFRKILLLSLFILPLFIFASTSDDKMDIGFSLFIAYFISIHFSAFVLRPLAMLIAKEENFKKVFWTLVVIRYVVITYIVLAVNPNIFEIDFVLIFVLGVPLSLIAEFKNAGKTISSSNTNPTAQISTTVPTGITLSCAKCGGPLQITDKFCAKCGAPFDGNNVVVSEGQTNTTIQKQVVKSSEFDQMYNLPEGTLVELFIEKELEKAGIKDIKSLLPSDALKRKNILNIIFAILVFVFITLIFFHFPVYTYIIGLIILIVFFIIKNRFNLMKYLIKQVKSRPGEKISNIVMNTKNTLVENNTKKSFLLYVGIAIILPLIIFATPKIIYEKVDGGYAVRYYVFGLTNITSASIPEEHNGEKVVSLRGNTFSNMQFLKTVTLPNTIKEIRGQAFYNCYRLTSVNLSSNLEYLGGGAFYNTKALKTIELPNTLTYLGGESFVGSGITHISLSENLTEIRGNTFENCTSLRSITIPDSVTRIGGHAFYGDSSLTKVNISPNSNLQEIGSSAFRRCRSLDSITIPKNTEVNSRAFKESPTNITRYGDTLYND